MLVVFEDKSKLLELIYPNFDEFNKEIIALINEFKTEENPPRTVFVSKMTEWNLQDEIKNQIISYVIDIIKTKFNSSDEELTCKYCWGVIYNSGHYISRHHHLEEGRYSFVYYVNAPEGSAPLIFSDFNFDVIPQTGKLILFDSCLMHEVPKNTCDGRIALVGVID